MTARVRTLLKTIERLPETERRDLAAEILRLSTHWGCQPLSDEALIENAEHLFLELDQAESRDA